METVRARAETALFGAVAPARLGRYLVVEKIAGGGMGIVYRGYDPELHRKVALKVLHPRQQSDDRAPARMMAEARALAKLDHPNVVRIHDVLGIDGQIVIVMELIEGTTLASWEREATRPWRDIVTMYQQAAQGLAAAHGVGVVHRDFKPANAVIGVDGRVRVLDFGLARSVESPESPALAIGSPDSGAQPAANPDLTATGEFVGTLGYTSPEQLAGETATPASDQFSFCVSLHRALENAPPFAGVDPDRLLEDIRSGRVARATDGRRIPVWLRALTARGLRATPPERFASMEEIIRVLRRPRGWRRWRGPVAATLVFCAAGLAIATRPAASEGPSCDGGGSEISSAWNDDQRTRVTSALDSATAASPLQDVRPRVVAALDAYRDRWTAVHRDACVVHHRGEQSDALLDLRMACLARRQVELQEAVSVLIQTTPATAPNAIDVVARLPDPTLCSDVAHLQSETEPPTTPSQRKNVDAVRVALSRAAALDRAGRSDEALSVATIALTDAQRTAHAPVIAEAGLLRGRLLLMRRDFLGAAPQLASTRALALEQRLYTTAVEAAARQIYAESMEHPDLASLTRDTAILEPLARSLGGDHFARPLLLNNIGAAYMASGKRLEAEHYFELAHDALQEITDPDLELTCINKNLAMVTSDDRRRHELARSAWIARRAKLGDHHPETLEALDSYGRFVRTPTEALALMNSACTGFDLFASSLTEQRAYCHHFQGFLLEHIGDRDNARSAYELGAAAISEDNEQVWSQLCAADAARLRHDDKTASELYGTVLARDESSPHWFIRLRAAHAAFGMGQLREINPNAYRHLAVALQTYQEAVLANEQIEFTLRLAHLSQLLEAAQQAAPQSALPHTKNKDSR